MRIKFWGVRGSTPTPQLDNLRYGGNTSCVEVRLGDNLYVFDCGTGLRSLGQQLQRDSEGKAVRAHIFVSHFHWDHIQGIPFFGPLYDNPENCFSFHSSSRFRTLKQSHGRTDGRALLSRRYERDEGAARLLQPGAGHESRWRT